MLPSTLPLTLPYRLSWKMSILMVGMGILLILTGFLPMSSFANDGPFKMMAIKYGSPVFGALAILTYLRLNVFGHSFLRIDQEKLEFHHFFGTKILAWSDVVGCNLYSIQDRGMIGFVTKQHQHQKKGFMRKLNAVVGIDYSLSIPTDNLHGIDPRELVAMMKDLHLKAG
ncbi:MAG: hypothetical protein IPO40_20575 [Fibrobacteres bacterium]|nr:hypothetical protein [Fibrobacterota bacterium]